MASIKDILKELEKNGEVKLAIKVTKQAFQANPMLRFALEQADKLGIDIHIQGIEKV
jgi:hypothetical protein